MERQLKVIKMNKEDYFKKYGDAYEEGNLFDYPFNEIDHIINDTDIEVVALIEDRLFEVPEY